MAARSYSESQGLRRLFRILYLEAFFVIIYETWVSPAYLSGLAGEFKIDLGLVSILAAIPSIGSIGQFLGVWTFERSSSVKPFVMKVSGWARFLWVIPLFLAVLWGQQGARFGTEFPARVWFLLTALCACCSSILASCSTNAGMYWMKALVPPRFQGRFFGYRQQFSTAAFVGASGVAAFLVGWAPHGYRLGLGLLCVLGLMAGAVAFYQSWKIEDVSIEKTDRAKVRSLREIFRPPFRDPEFRKFLLFGAGFNGVIQLTNSYFPYYFTRDLKISLSSVTLWIGISNIGSFVSAKGWGRLADRPKGPFKILWITGHFLALCPLFYLFSEDRSLIQSLAPLEYLLNGLAWSGFSLAQIKLLLRMSPANSTGAAYFSLYTALCGVSGAVFTVVGGKLALLLAPWGGFRALWLMGALVRLGVLWYLCRPFLSAEPTERVFVERSGSCLSALDSA